MAEPEQSVGEDCISFSSEIYSKLCLLNYGKELVKNKGFRPLIEDYFAVAINQNDQFSYFKALVKWLFQLNNVTGQDISSYDDPNTIGMGIQSQLRTMGINIDVSGIK